MRVPRVLLPVLAAGCLAVSSGPLPASAAPGLAAAVVSTSRAEPLERAHAHNDYEHDRPLQDALAAGFTSVEADVYLVGSELLVAHDPQGVRAGVDLRTLYLDPLRAQVRASRGHAYPGYRGVFQLLVDVKTDPVLTYRALDQLLAQYRDVLWRWDDGRTVPGAVQVVVSGNRDRLGMQNQRVRYAGYDARLIEVGTVDGVLSPLVSDSFTDQFTWRGIGAMPTAERAKLRAAVSRAHAAGQRVRFYNTPDAAPERTAVWAELVAAGVDHLNTDDLEAMRSWLLANDPQENRRAA